MKASIQTTTFQTIKKSLHNSHTSDLAAGLYEETSLPLGVVAAELSAGFELYLAMS